MKEYKHYAFISYSHKDAKYAKWLHKKLEGYKLPNEIHNEFEDTRYLRPVFRDQDDLNTGLLQNELRAKLESSKYLIVICSPNSAHSDWVNQEIQVFINLGRIERIIPFIINGEPFSKGTCECFPEALISHFSNHPDEEILGINLFEDRKEKALIRVVSRMLGIDFDVLWQRHKRELYRRISILLISAIVLLFAVLWLCIPISLTVCLKDEKHSLPPLEDGTFHIADNEYLFHSLDTVLTISPFPGYMRGRKISCTVSATSRYETLSTNFKLTTGLKQSINLQMRRNKEFAIHSGQVLNEESVPIPGAIINIDNRTAITDSLGVFSIEFPTEEQTYSKQLFATHPDYQPCVITSYASYCRFILRK